MLHVLLLSPFGGVSGASCEGAGGKGGGLGTDKLLQLASSLAAKQLAKAPGACGQEELLLHLQILQVRVRLAGYTPHTLAIGLGKVLLQG